MIFIVIPVYNVEEYIRECFDSLKSQTISQIKYIVVDDGSTDKSGQICDEYANRDNRFHVIHSENGGVSSARNKALAYINENSNQDGYVMFVDPDDYLVSAEAIKIINNKLNEGKPDILYFNYTTNSNTLKGQHLENRDFKDEEIGKKVYPMSLFNIYSNGIVLNSCLWRAAFSLRIIAENKIKFREDIRKAEDTLFFAHFLNFVNKASIIDDVIYFYRLRDTSITNKYTFAGKKGFEKGLSILREFEDYTHRMPGISTNIVQSYFSNRKIQIITKYAINYTDPRGKHSYKSAIEIIGDLLRSNYSTMLISSIGTKHISTLKSKLEFRLIKSKNTIGLILYAKLYHLAKRIKSSLS